MHAVLTMALLVCGASAGDEPLNLADFGRVVRFTDTESGPGKSHEIERGSDGWTAWKAEDGQWMIGLEWDEPRELAEVQIEFRHAIAYRDKLKVQYLHGECDSSPLSPGGASVETSAGQWVTPPADWWAGDRDVGFAFRARTGQDAGDKPATIRTRRLRFLLGRRDEELPAVRYIRAYGPEEIVQVRLEFRLEVAGLLALPLDVTVVNGTLVDTDGSTTRSASLSAEPARLRVGYARTGPEALNRTRVTVRDPRDPQRGFSFWPDEVVRRGIIRIPTLGVTVVHTGTTLDLQAGYQPNQSAFTRMAADSVPVIPDIKGVAFPAGSDGGTAAGDSSVGSIEVPDKGLSDAWAALAQGNVEADGGRAKVAGNREGYLLARVRQIELCQLAGRFDQARKMLARDWPETRLGRASQTGERTEAVLSDISLAELRMLWLFSEHYRLTRDRRWLTEIAPMLVRACKAIERACQGGLGADDPDDLWRGVGLLPTSRPGCDAGGVWSPQVNAWAGRALQATADVLTEINDPQAKPLAERARAFTHQIQQCSREALVRAAVVRLSDGTYAPVQPESGAMGCGRHAAGLALIDCGIYAPGESQTDALLCVIAETFAEDRPLADGVGIDHQGSGTVVQTSAASVDAVCAWVRTCLGCGLPQHALAGFAGGLEQCRKLAAAGDPGATDAMRAMLVALRHMLIDEQGRTLHLLPSLPSTWLAAGRTVRLEGLPTFFGPIRLEVEVDGQGGQIRIRLAGPLDDRPDGIRLHMGTGRRIQAVTVNGRTVSDFDPAAGLVRLRPADGPMEIEVRY